MDHRDYEAFETLCQTLHFGRASRALGMSPSALTRRLQAMEEELGQELFLRTNKQVELTASGTIFRRFAQSQLIQLEELKNALRSEEQSPTGELLIACTVTACHTVLPELLAQFRAKFPGVTLRLITQDAGRSLTQLEAGEVDLAVIPAETEGLPGLVSSSLGWTEFAFIAPRDAGALAPLLSQRPLPLAQLPLVCPLGGLERKRLFDWLRKQQVTPHVVAEVRGNEGIIAMVSLGSGVALVPELVLESSPLKGRVVSVEGMELPPGYHVSLCAKAQSLERRVVSVFWQEAAARRSPAATC